METWKVSCFAKKYFRKLGKLITLEKIGARSAPKKNRGFGPLCRGKRYFLCTKTDPKIWTIKFRKLVKLKNDILIHAVDVPFSEKGAAAIQERREADIRYVYNGSYRFRPSDWF